MPQDEDGKLVMTAIPRDINPLPGKKLSFSVILQHFRPISIFLRWLIDRRVSLSVDKSILGIHDEVELEKKY